MDKRAASQDPRRRQHVMLGGLAVALVSGLAVVVWMLMAGDTGQSTTDETGVRFQQEQGESIAGKHEPASSSGPNDPARACNKLLRQQLTGVQLDPVQRGAINTYFSRRPELRRDSVDFSIAIGAAVPRQAQLQRIPTELSGVIPEYADDSYILVGDQMVVVEFPLRRIVAIVPTAN